MKNFRELVSTLVESDDEDLDELFDEIADFLLAMDETLLPEETQEQYYYLMDGIEQYYNELEEEGYYDEDNDPDADEDDDLEEGVAPVKKRINRQIQRQRKMEYRRNKVRLKLKARKLRRLPKHKKYLRKKKRMARMGKTARGKRMSKFI